MGARYFTSDPHFGHKYVAIDVRGFSSIEEHDAELTEIWNKTVRSDDIVIIAGDYSLKNPSQPGWPDVNRLSGRKILISGNHDACWSGHRDAWKTRKDYLDAGFDAIMDFMRLKLDGNQVLISHFPYDGDHTPDDRSSQYRLRDYGLPLIHGHTHLNNRFSFSVSNTLQIHVGMDAHHFKPVREDFIIESLRLSLRLFGKISEGLEP